MMGRMVTTVLNKLRGGETGQAFIIVLVLLLLGGLMIGPLLGFMSTGLIAGQANEKRMSEVYAADAGIEDAVWRIQTRDERVPTVDEPASWSYDLADEFGSDGEPNNRSVSNIIEYIDDHTYKVTATATTDATSDTVVESYITVPDWDFTLNNAITSRGDITIQPGSEVVGNVLYDSANGELDNKGVITGDIDDTTIEQWPTPAQLGWFYRQDVDISDPYPSNTFDLNGVSTSIGPEYIEGGFSIYNSKNTVATLTLTGTLYITGKTNFGGSKKWILDLNNQTVFVESALTGGGASGTAFWLDPKITVTGSGCIVAVGDIYFAPNISSSPDEFMLVMSAAGETAFQPNGAYYGAIVGDANVSLQPGNYLEWVDPHICDDEGGINFPWEGFLGEKVVAEIRTWEINPPE